MKFDAIEVINYTDKTFIKACHVCDAANPENGMGMVPTHFKNMQFVNATFKPYIKFTSPEIGKDLIVDEDGSLFGKM